MLYETGRVVAVDSDGLWLETLKKSSCGQCSAKAGCGQQLLAKSALTNMTFIKALFATTGSSDAYVSGKTDRHQNFDDTHSVALSQQWKIGDIAEIALDENTLVKATVIAYLLPLLCMVVGTVFAAQLFSSDYIVAVSAVIGLILGGVLVRAHANGLFRSENPNKESCYHAFVVRKV